MLDTGVVSRTSNYVQKNVHAADYNKMKFSGNEVFSILQTETSNLCRTIYFKRRAVCISTTNQHEFTKSDLQFE